MAKQTPEAPPAKVALYDKLIATTDKVVRKGAKSAYTSINGNMQSFLNKQGRLCLRLPTDELEAFAAKYRTKRPVEYGTVMKEYVLVPDALFRKTAEVKKYFDRSLAYVAGLKAKPTTRKKATTKKATTKKATTKKKVTAKKKATSKKAGRKVAKKSAKRST